MSDLTPEEKLLKIIEQSSQKPQAGASANARVPLMRKFFNKQYALSLMRLRTLQQVLAVVCAIGIVFVYSDFSKAYQDNEKRFNTVISAPRENVPIRKFFPRVALADAVGDTQARGLFGAYPAAEAAAAQEPEPVAQESMDNLAVVGIIWSEQNPQAMIEDKKGVSTSLVSTGDMVGAMKVVRIMFDRVVLEYKGAEYELR